MLVIHDLLHEPRRRLPPLRPRHAHAAARRLALLLNDLMLPGDKIATYDPFAPQESRLQSYWLRPWDDDLAARHNALWLEAYRLQLRSDLLYQSVKPVSIPPTLP